MISTTSPTSAAVPTAALPATFEPEIAVVGLGYVGLPLAMTFAAAGKTVLGVDVSADKVLAVREGKSYIEDVASDELKKTVDDGLFQATTRFGELAKVKAIIIAVPTPLSRNREPDLTYVISAAKAIAPHLQHGQLVVLESTTYPGTTRELVLPILAADGLKVGEDFFLAYSPERVDPGNETWNTTTTPKVLGGVTPACVERGAELYESAIDSVHRVTTPEAAELTKLFENIFRSVNIALVNEMAMLCDRMGIDVWEVIEAAATKPFGFMKFTPGPGLGGHCIPIDPFYLTWKAREYDFSTEFIELAGKINSNMPYFCLQKIERALNSQERALKGSKLLLLGMAYKKDVSDWRESPAVKVLELIREHGAKANYHDTFVSTITLEDGSQVTSDALTDAAIEEADAVIILTDHTTIDYANIVDRAKLVVDFRNVTAGLPGNENVWTL
jgi:UDP-N-acetyl-D-glucosamine dehydrogenase